MSTTVYKPVPTLSSQGWVYQIPEKCDFMLAHFFLTDGLQSHIYPDAISNLQTLVAENNSAPAALASKLRSRLNDYFGRYFDAAMIEVSVDETLDNPNIHEIKLYISITDDGKTYSAGKLLREMNGKFSMVMDINNNGSTT